MNGMLEDIKDLRVGDSVVLRAKVKREIAGYASMEVEFSTGDSVCIAQKDFMYSESHVVEVNDFVQFSATGKHRGGYGKVIQFNGDYAWIECYDGEMMTVYTQNLKRDPDGQKRWNERDAIRKGF